MSMPKFTGRRLHLINLVLVINQAVLPEFFRGIKLYFAEWA